MAARLCLPATSNGYRQALCIPLDDLQLFSENHLAWLRYVAYTIYGREGHISLSPNGIEVEDDEGIGPQKYYYVVSESALFLDPDLMDDRTSIITTESTDRGDFRQRVTGRDATCVLTGVDENLTACHIVPHAKTHAYMTNLANHRGEDMDSPLDDINDTRNGILLYSAFHRAFGMSGVAFLRTPNFAMDVTDVARVAQPDAVLEPLSTVEKRVTFQHFNTTDRNLARLAPHNCDARIADSDEWPPDLIFDVAYGCAALDKWGTSAFMKFARDKTFPIYYDGGANSDDANGKPGNLPQQTDERAAERAARGVGLSQQAVTAAEENPDIHDIILGLWMRSARKDKSRADAAKVDRTKVKEIQTWRDSVP